MCVCVGYLFKLLLHINFNILDLCICICGFCCLVFFFTKFLFLWSTWVVSLLLFLLMLVVIQLVKCKWSKQWIPKSNQYFLILLENSSWITVLLIHCYNILCVYIFFCLFFIFWSSSVHLIFIYKFEPIYMELTLQNGYIYVEQLNYLVFYGDLQFFFYISNGLCVCVFVMVSVCFFSAYFQYILLFE